MCCLLLSLKFFLLQFSEHEMTSSQEEAPNFLAIYWILIDNNVDAKNVNG